MENEKVGFAPDSAVDPTNPEKKFNPPVELEIPKEAIDLQKEADEAAVEVAKTEQKENK
jgi:hypothetical protein